MKIALFTKHLGRSWQVSALYKEAVSRGHQVDVFVDCQKLSASYPLESLSIPWKADPVHFDAREKYDLVVPFSEPLNSSWLKETGFSLGLYPGGAGSYRNLASSTLSPLLHHVWISQHEFEQKERQRQGFYLDHPVIGMPSISLYKNQSSALKKEGVLSGLYLNGPPFSKALKEKFDAFLHRIAKRKKLLEIHVKERFSKNDEGLHFLWNPFEEVNSSSVVVHPAQASTLQLVSKCDFIMGVSSSAFLEALFLDKPVVVFSDFGQERFVGELTQDTYWYAKPGCTFCRAYDFEKDAAFYLQRAKTLEASLKKKIFPFADPAFHIVNAVEEIHSVFSQVPKRGLFIPLPYTDRTSYRESLLKWKQTVLKEPSLFLREMQEKKEILSVRKEILMRMAAIFPYILQEKIEVFCLECEGLLKQHLIEKVLENIPFLLYSWLVKNGLFSEEILVKEGDLIEGSVRFFFVEALLVLNGVDRKAFALFEERTKLVIPKAFEVYQREYAK